jgi:hypothetical protein
MAAGNMTDGAPLKLAVVGNCQVAGILAVLRVLLPDAEISGWHVGVTPVTREAIAEDLARYDVILSNIWDGEEGGLFDLGRLKERCATVVWMVPIVFTGFHPDSTYIFRGGQPLSGVVGTYHSAIIAAAYSLGLRPERVPSLFNSLVYSRLGYFDAFATAKEEFLAMHRQHGYDVAGHFDEWMRTGPFMYTINHPRIDALSTMATLAAIRAELVAPDTPIPHGVPDSLETHCRWPTYPEIARKIGVPGSMKFMRDSHGLAENDVREISLLEAVVRSYRVYADAPHLDFGSGRIGFVRERLKEMVVSAAG